MNVKTLIMTCGLAVCLLAQSAVAGPLEDAGAAYQLGDYATVLELLQPLAEQGEAHAQWGLGRLYATGRGVATRLR